MERMHFLNAIFKYKNSPFSRLLSWDMEALRNKAAEVFLAAKLLDINISIEYLI